MTTYRSTAHTKSFTSVWFLVYATVAVPFFFFTFFFYG